MSDATAFVCDLTALTPEQRQHVGVLSSELFSQVQHIRELPDGYAFRFSEDSSWLPKLADFITYDRLCCPFIHHGIDVEPSSGSIWLRLSGAEGIKPFIVADTTGLLKPEVAQAAGFIKSDL
jgi:hypothetical protein